MNPRTQKRTPNWYWMNPGCKITTIINDGNMAVKREVNEKRKCNPFQVDNTIQCYAA